MAKSMLALALVGVSAILSSCGASSPTLQSITINRQVATDFSQFTATGTYSNGKQVTPLAVNWVNTGLPIMTTTRPPYNLTASAFLPQCTNATIGIAALAPADPHAPSTGSVPLKVWQDIVFGTMKSEGGFVGATAQVTCP